jgi:hypothetical protein
MGGYGSGGSSHSGRPTVRQCMSLHISNFKKQDALKKGTSGRLDFGKNSLGFEVTYDDMLYIYWHVENNPERSSQHLGFQWLAHSRTFGGYQTYWVCPFCHGCFNILYFYRNRFACRKCHRLKYPSQRESPSDRLRRRVEKLAGGLQSMYEWLDDTIPSRPKGMRQATYERLAAQYEKILNRYHYVSQLELLRIVNRKYR